MISKIFIGSDVLRNPEADGWPKWSYETRKRFLLRPEIEWPISVDRLICPSIFQPKPISTEKTFFVPLNPRAQTVISNVSEQEEPPEDELNLVGYWQDPWRMQQWLRSQAGSNRTYRSGVLISVLTDNNSADQSWWETLQPTISQPFPNSSLLGFDVADKNQTSILSNCGREIEEVDQDRKRWAEAINDFGLFSKQDDAVEFRDAHSATVDHSPAYVYEIRQILQ